MKSTKRNAAKKQAPVTKLMTAAQRSDTSRIAAKNAWATMLAKKNPKQSRILRNEARKLQATFNRKNPQFARVA